MRLGLRALRTGTNLPLAPGNFIGGSLKGSTASFDVSLSVAPPNYGARAKLEVEVKPSSQTFDGLGLVSSTAFVSVVPNTALRLTVNVLKGSSYHFRARVLFDANQPVGTQRGPWIYGGISGQPTWVHLRTPAACPTCLLPPPLRRAEL
jgi:hypothetical protein